MTDNPQTEPMRIEYALALLCRVHIEEAEDGLFSVQAPLSSNGWYREEDYVAAWAAMRDVLMSRRRLIEELEMPGHAILDRLSPELRQKISEAFNPGIGRFTVQPSESFLRHVVDMALYGAKSPRDVIEALFGALLAQGKLLDEMFKNSLALTAMQPMEIVMPKKPEK